MEDKEIIAKFESTYWKDYYSTCTSCKNKCKQSHTLLELYCPQYIERVVRKRK